jgi:hypothetical protein
MRRSADEPPQHVRRVESASQDLDRDLLLEQTVVRSPR